MVLGRVASVVLQKGLNASRRQNVGQFNLAFLLITPQIRNISSMEVTKNIYLLSEEKKDNKIINLKLDRPDDKPLVVMLTWLMAKKKYVYKYADIYLQRGFDVLTVHISPWEVLWPTKGSQLLAKDLLKFLDLNTAYSPLTLHGFSVGGYMWGETLVHVAAERKKYDHILERIVGQVWDSAADVTEISIGLPKAVFPRNEVLQNALKQYILYHMKAFDKVSTRHYIRASQMFHTNLVRSPALFLLSKTDPIGAEKSNQRVRESWENMGTQVTWQCWDKSPHVGHFRFHKKEYLEILNSFLDNLQLTNQKENVKVKAEN